MKKSSLIIFLAVTLLVATVPNASALTITRNFTGGAAHVSAVGGGNLQSIFNDAADWWEVAIQDAHALSINYSWAALTPGTLGAHSLGTQGGVPNRELTAQIRFDNDGSSVFFMDTTPNDNSEYTTYTESSADLGGGVINTGRNYTGATGFALGIIDLFSVAIHEIGHALGLSAANTSFQADNVDGDIDVTSGPFAGSAIQTISGAHLNLTNSLMFPSISNSERNLMSAADILANCTISQFTNCNLDPYAPAAVPEPGTILLLGSGLVGLAVTRRKMHRKI